MSHRLRILMVVVGTFTVTFSAAWYWLWHTSSGATFVWSAAQSNVPGELGVGRIEGNLSGGLRLRNLQFRNDALEISMQESGLAVDVDLIPPSVEIRSLHASNVQVVTGDHRNNDAAGIDIAEVLTALRLPIEISLTDIQIISLSLAQAGQEPREIVSSISMAASLHDRLSIDRLDAISTFGNFTASLNFGLEPPFAMELAADAAIKDIGVNGITGVELIAKLKGDEERVDVEITSIAPDLQVSGEAGKLFSQPQLDLHATSSKIGWPVQASDPEFSVSHLDARVSGTVGRYEVDARGNLYLEKLGDVAITIAGTGTRERFTISKATARGNRIDASASGVADWSSGLNLKTQLRSAKFDPRGWVPTWPESYSLQGEFSGGWREGDIEIALLELRIPQANISASGHGDLDIEENILDGELVWRGIQWPLDADEPPIGSSSGEVSLKGNPSAWFVDGKFKLKTPSLPEGDLTVSAGGDLDSIAVTIHESDILGGNVRGNAEYRWRDTHPYSGSLNIDGLQTAVFDSEWPGTWHADIKIEGEGQPFAIKVDLANLHGEIRDRPISASGLLSFAPKTLEFRNFHLVHGGASVALDGALYDEIGVTYEINVAEIGEYMDLASGSIEGSGRLSLDAASPRFRGALSAARLMIGGIAIETLEIEDRAGDNGGFVNQSIVASGIEINETSIDTLSISAIGDTDHHDVQLDLQSEGISASIRAVGALTQWQEMATVRWQGELTALQVEFPSEQTFMLGSPALFDISADEFSLETICLDVDRNNALCMRAHWNRASSLDLSAEFQAFPVSALLVMIDTDLLFSQELTGQLSWSQSITAPTNAEARIGISPGRIVSDFDSSLAIDTGSGVLDFQLTDGKFGSGKIDLPFPGFGDIDIDFRVEDMELGADSPFSGRALIELSDIQLFAEFVPTIDSDGGRLETDLAISGTLRNPSLAGNIDLRDASLRYLPLGTTLSDVQIDATVLDKNQLDLRGRFRAGEGNGTVVTSAAYEDGRIPNLEFTIKGTDLVLIDHPELRVNGNPDLSIGVRNREILLDGRLLISKALVTPAIIPEGRISESQDVRIVAGELPVEQQTAGDEQPYRINGSVEVEFGDEVVVDLGVATANLSGSVIFDWRDNLMPIAKGAFTVDGTIAALGQVLDVDEGNISYADVPADNPSLRIAAEREIFGNTQIKRAGILLTGTAKKPIMEAYTYPLTTEERALTLLATGSDFDYEQGVGALDFGVYIAPRFYLSYGIGLFERDNIISARFDLKRGFGIKASSGQRESGIDISYRLDR